MDVKGIPSYFDRGTFVTVDDDVLNVVRDLREISPRLNCWYDEHSDTFHVTEDCLDGVTRLVLTAKTLDQRVVNQVRSADHWHGNDRPRVILGEDEDVLSKVDAHNDALEAGWREETRGKIHDAGERIAWALDICSDRSSVGGSILVPKGVS